MKKIFLFYMLLFFTSIHIFTMELAHSTIERTSSYQDFYSTPRAFNWIDPKNQTLTIKKLLLLQKSKLFNHDMSNNIAYKLFVLYTKDEYENLEKICPLRLGNAEYTIEQVVKMPYAKRKKVIEIAHPKTVLQIIEGYDHKTISEYHYKELQEILPDNMKDNLQIEVIQNSCCLHYSPKIIGLSIFLAGCGFGVTGIATSQACWAMPSIPSLIAGPILTILLQRGINIDRRIDSQEYDKLLP